MTMLHTLPSFDICSAFCCINGCSSSYLADRTQQVVINGQVSLVKNVKLGVPQGSILRPLLYTIYTSPLQTSFQNCKSHLYADETQLYFSFKPSDVLDATNQYYQRWSV